MGDFDKWTGVFDTGTVGIGICGLQVTKSVSSSDEMEMISSRLREDEDEDESRDESNGELGYVLLGIDSEVDSDATSDCHGFLNPYGLTGRV